MYKKLKVVFFNFPMLSLCMTTVICFTSTPVPKPRIYYYLNFKVNYLLKRF